MDEELLSKSSEFTERGASHAEERISTASCNEDVPLHDVIIDPCCVSVAMECSGSAHHR